jgi:hypothetical protein
VVKGFGDQILPAVGDRFNVIVMKELLSGFLEDVALDRNCKQGLQ